MSNNNESDNAITIEDVLKECRRQAEKLYDDDTEAIERAVKRCRDLFEGVYDDGTVTYDDIFVRKYNDKEAFYNHTDVNHIYRDDKYDPRLKNYGLREEVLPYLIVDERTGSFTIHADVIQNLISGNELLSLIHDSILGKLRSAYPAAAIQLYKLKSIFNKINNYRYDKLPKDKAITSAKNIEELVDFLNSMIELLNDTINEIMKAHGFRKNDKGKVYIAENDSLHKMTEYNNTDDVVYTFQFFKNSIYCNTVDLVNDSLKALTDELLKFTLDWRINRNLHANNKPTIKVAYSDIPYELYTEWVDYLTSNPPILTRARELIDIIEKWIIEKYSVSFE